MWRDVDILVPECYDTAWCCCAFGGFPRYLPLPTLPTAIATTTFNNQETSLWCAQQEVVPPPEDQIQACAHPHVFPLYRFRTVHHTMTSATASQHSKFFDAPAALRDCPDCGAPHGHPPDGPHRHRRRNSLFAHSDAAQGSERASGSGAHARMHAPQRLKPLHPLRVFVWSGTVFGAVEYLVRLWHAW